MDNQQILDTIGVAKETFHSIKSQNLKALVLQLDLLKDSDHVDWGFLGLVLIQNNISLDATRWVMACVTFVIFDVLVNGVS